MALSVVSPTFVTPTTSNVGGHGALRGPSVVDTLAGSAKDGSQYHLATPVSGLVVAGVVVAKGSRKRAMRRALPTPGGAAASPALSVTDSAEIPAPPPPFNPADQVGAVAPLGFFDPLNFTTVGDEAGFRKLRAAEIKHGRVAMMASIGAVGQHFIKFPFAENVHGTFGVLTTGVGTLGMFFIFCVCSIVELAWREDPNSRWAGDYGDPFGVKMFDDDTRNKEINNGRMAMISVLGIWAAELATGKDAIEQFGFTDAVDVATTATVTAAVDVATTATVVANAATVVQ